MDYPKSSAIASALGFESTGKAKEVNAYSLKDAIRQSREAFESFISDSQIPGLSRCHIRG